MQQLKYFGTLLTDERKEIAMVTVQRGLNVMDTGIRFMASPHYDPANPAISVVRKPLVAGLWMLLALTLVILVWGMLAPLDSAAVARGTVMLLSNKKSVQHLEGGIIQDLLVQEGDRVNAGEPLVILNDTAASASRDLLQGQLFVARATQSRLVAERDGLEDITFDTDLVEGAKNSEALAKIIANQKRLFTTGREAQAAKLAILQQRIAQSEESMNGLQAQKQGTAEQNALLDQEIATVKELLDSGYATKTRLFELERHKSELQGSHGQYEGEIGKLQQTIAETKMEIVNQQKEFEAKNSEGLRDAQAQIADLTDKLRAAKDVAERTIITAPVSGIVTGLKFHTVGGVVAPGATLMDIVPQDDRLIIEARVRPTDISTVHAGLDARVIFTAYKMRSTPKVPGKVTLVSADTFTEPNTNPPISYYTARVEVDKTFLKSMEKKIELVPGMPAEVMINTGSRSFLAYLFQPITDSMHRAFREQ